MCSDHRLEITQTEMIHQYKVGVRVNILHSLSASRSNSRSSASRRHKYLSSLTSAFSFITAGENIRVARASASFRRRFRDMLLGRRGDPPRISPSANLFIVSVELCMIHAPPFTIRDGPVRILCPSVITSPRLTNFPGISRIPSSQISGCCQEYPRLSVLVRREGKISRKFCTEKHFIRGKRMYR